MKIVIRILALLLRIVGSLIVRPILSVKYKRQVKMIPPIKNDLLKIPAVDLAEKIRKKEVTSEQVVKLYVERLREVNKIVNAVVDERYNHAIEEAKKADRMCETVPQLYLLQNYPLLGVPFTVKESVGVKGLLHTGGSLARLNLKSDIDGESVRLLRAAGAIPLCVSNTPEWSMSWESFNYVTGRTLNPYDLSRTAGGSSGGEAALIGSGASLFGPGSDIAGSIRVPALFTGIFGHKPTPNVVNLNGHFPNSADKKFQSYLTVGPMTRYAKDLIPLLHIMSGNNAPKLRLGEPVLTKNIKIFYQEDLGNNISAIPVDKDIQASIRRAVDHFKSNGLVTRKPHINLTNSLEIGLAMLLGIEEVPDLVGYQKPDKVRDNILLEMCKCLFGKSKYTFAALAFSLLSDLKHVIPKRQLEKYTEKGQILRKQFIDLLGEDGVFFYPTYCKPAIYHYESLLTLYGVTYTKIFNVLGFPSCHVPMGLNDEGLPIGFQVVAAPYQDRLCLSIAIELEHAFGGWVPPPS